MAIYTAWVVRKQYFQVEIEADSWEDATLNALNQEVDISNPDNVDWDIYDLELKESV
jgi:hypothetical protein